jgi:hypothetical protein
MLRQHSVFLGICLTYVVIGYLYITYFGEGQGRQLSYTSYFFMRMLWPIIIIGAGIFIVREAVVERPEKLTRHCWSKMRAQYLTAERLLPAVPIVEIDPPLLVQDEGAIPDGGEVAAGRADRFRPATGLHHLH